MKSPPVIRIFKETDERSLAMLMKETFGFSEDFWKWKHKSYPGFTPQSMTVAEECGKIVGSSSWIVRDLKLSSPLIVRAALGCDSAVDAEHRGQRVGSSVMEFCDRQLKGNGIVVEYGFARPEAARKFYGPLGWTMVRDHGTMYKKILSCNRWKEKIHSVAEKDKTLSEELVEIDLAIKFNLTGAPTFLISIKNGKIKLYEIKEAPSLKPDVTLEGESSLLMPFFEGKKGVFGLLKLLLTRKIKTRGTLKNSVVLFRAFRIIARAMRAKS